MRDEKQIVWMFRFGLEREDGQTIGAAGPEELLDVIIKWAEDNDYQIGGGYSAPTEEESQIGEE